MVRALADAQFAGTRYFARITELLETGLQEIADELGAVVLTDVGGASGVIKLEALIGDVRGCLRRLPRARMLVCELPDDTPFSDARAALLEAGFVEEALVPDLLADGIGLTILVRR